MAGSYSGVPRGIIWHGSRSTLNRSTHDEFIGTAEYEPRSGLGWTATIGDDEVCLHMTFRQWGWNARAASPLYLACEFSQPVESRRISEGQVRAFCWFFMQARKVWATLPQVFPTHADLDGTVEYGGYLDGKTDVYRKGSPDTFDLRHAVSARFKALGVSG